MTLFLSHNGFALRFDCWNNEFAIHMITHTGFEFGRFTKCPDRAKEIFLERSPNTPEHKVNKAIENAIEQCDQDRIINGFTHLLLEPFLNDLRNKV